MERRPKPIAMLAHELAMSAESFYEMCSLARQGRTFRGAMTLRRWMSG
jgi:hypothetical protein